TSNRNVQPTIAGCRPRDLAARALATEDVGDRCRACLRTNRLRAAPGPGGERLAAFRGHVDHARAGRPVQPLYSGGVTLGDDPAAAFERRGELAGLCGPLGA